MNSNTITLTFFISLTILYSAALGQDSLVYPTELTFDNYHEQQAYWQLYNQQEEPYFELFYLLTDSSIDRMRNYKALLYSELETIKRVKNETKYVKNIYKRLHERFFSKYEERSFFADVFSSRTYNCVTACAIYGLAFDKLGIPFEIKETPTHVYIIAYPDSHQIRIETTDPVGGFASYSPLFKQAFVTRLLELKLIDNDDMSLGTNALFDKYYFNDSKLGLKELVALQYYNAGLFEGDQAEYYKAYRLLSKAYVLYPSDQTSKYLLTSIINELAVSKYDEEYHITLLAQLPRYKKFEITNDEIVGEFGRINEQYLINTYNVPLYDSIYYRLTAQLNDSSVVSEIHFIYNYERARLLFNKGKYIQALPFAEKALEQKPTHVDAETLLISSFMNYLSQSRNPEKAIEKLEAYIKRFHTLNENNHVQKAWLNLNLLAMEKSYEDQNIEAAKTYAANFEKGVERNETADFDRFLVGRAYSTGAIYYFKRGYLSSARRLLNKGLEYAPGNYELKSRLQMINR